MRLSVWFVGLLLPSHFRDEQAHAIVKELGRTQCGSRVGGVRQGRRTMYACRVDVQREGPGPSGRLLRSSRQERGEDTLARGAAGPWIETGRQQWHPVLPRASYSTLSSCVDSWSCCCVTSSEKLNLSETQEDDDNSYDR